MSREFCPWPARLPVEPLARALRVHEATSERNGQPMPWLALAYTVGVTRHTVTLWKKRRLSIFQADAAAAAVGLHPAEVWGDAWLDACAWMDPDVIEEWRRRDVDTANALEAARA